ncbi:1,6-anhydro-N-acetylmuramyl-L-alanine amidase AmpD [Ectothiorhodospira shaposhnikovii]|uniref:1,6-anhydro-N-acetylmuramyl-L-alanine amidase AmpD n=1 Tax=Ectothiorhodospira shaposhnikovii TaxID=1054 RepID=UPI001EE8983D|nr:1,6-anhydro-N-acetylmuramyl-L-alanine amidase AmpD [Ectothiorhodospira shaposhnikovii]MCG5512156.1 1,6-anhydro-N-acetylmuramyl-L-alanine amidase AmpD [Ectothiorhodospira shaposhnikovii]
MDIDTTGWLDIATRVPSPNQDARPPGMTPELIVIHAISLPPGEFGGPWIDRLFTNALPPEGHPFFAQIQGLRVSAHVLIRRDGEMVQYVPFLQRAWHAGVSCFQGRERCNDFSIGIELEGSDVHPFTGAQYERLARLITVLKKTYTGLADAPVVGHSDIAPGRKTDPGPCFEWSRLQVLSDA